jgi:hypothetical protein
MRLLWPRLTSRSARARCVPAQCPASPFQASSGISQGKARDLRSIRPPHLRPLGPECLRASGSMAPSPTSRTPPMRFVFLGPELCLQLPSRVSSRSYGCCSARGSRHSGPPEDSHLQVTSRFTFAPRFLRPPHGGPRHAWRTTKEALRSSRRASARSRVEPRQREGSRPASRVNSTSSKAPP